MQASIACIDCSGGVCVWVGRGGMKWYRWGGKEVRLKKARCERRKGM